MGKGILLWLVGIQIPIIIVLWIFRIPSLSPTMSFQRHYRRVSPASRNAAT